MEFTLGESFINAIYNFFLSMSIKIAGVQIIYYILVVIDFEVIVKSFTVNSLIN